MRPSWLVQFMDSCAQSTPRTPALTNAPLAIVCGFAVIFHAQSITRHGCVNPNICCCWDARTLNDVLEQHSAIESLRKRLHFLFGFSAIHLDSTLHEVIWISQVEKIFVASIFTSEIHAPVSEKHVLVTKQHAPLMYLRTSLRCYTYTRVQGIIYNLGNPIKKTIMFPPNLICLANLFYHSSWKPITLVFDSCSFDARFFISRVHNILYLMRMYEGPTQAKTHSYLFHIFHYKSVKPEDCF